MVLHGITIPEASVADFCRRNRIVRLAVFGSAVRDDFGPCSDIDVLVWFEPHLRVGLFTLAEREAELSEMLGRKVDLNTPGSLSPHFRDSVLEEAVSIYGPT